MVPEAATAAQRRLYKASVPEGWRIVHLAHIFEQVVDTGHKADLPVLSVTLNGQIVRRSSLDRKSDREVPRDKYLRVKPGDIAYNTMRMWQGASGLVKEEGYISPAYTVCRPKEDECSEFWAAHFRSEPTIRAFRDHSQGFARDRYRLYFHHFGTVPALRPPLAEQRKISEILSSIEVAIKKTETVGIQLKSFKRSLMQELLTRGIPQRHTRFSNTKLLGRLPTSWNIARLRDAGKWLSGGTPSKTDISLWSGSIPWVSPKDMKRTRLSDTLDHVSPSAIGNGTQMVPPGTILMVVRGMILAHSFPVALAVAPLCFNQDIKALRPSDEFDPEFVLYWLTFAGPRILSLTSASTHGTQRIPSESLLECGIPIPPLQEQKEIVKLISAVDNLNEKSASERETTELLRKALMPRLLSGEVRVKSEGTS
jgi:type I restriction enzyme S subunit